MGFGRKTNSSGEHSGEPARELCAGTVTRVAQQMRDPERVSVFIDDEFAFGLTLDLAAREGLKKGIPLSIEAQQALLDQEKDFHARAVALNYVGYQARTVEEVRRKLREKGYGADITDDVVQRLADNGYLDDEAYAKAYVESRFSGSGHGPRRLSADLIKRGVDRGIVERAVSEAFDDDELRDAALQQGRKRWAALERETDLRKRKKRVMDFLARRGFDYGLAREIVEGLVEEVD